jgi:hypothetical protein
MTDLLELKPNDVVLEIGTGLGYQAAVLAELASRIYSVEIIEELAKALHRLSRGGGKALPYENPPADSSSAMRTIVRAPIKAYFAARAKA